MTNKEKEKRVLEMIEIKNNKLMRLEELINESLSQNADKNRLIYTKEIMRLENEIKEIENRIIDFQKII